MTTRILNIRYCCWLWLAAMAAGVFPATAAAGDMKLEVVLVWGTNSEKSPDSKHKPVDPEIAKKLGELPFKWTHYFEVCRKPLTLAAEEESKRTMSPDCEIAIKNLGKGQVEVTLIGKGHPVGTIKQKLRKDETLVTGGDAPNFTGWFIVIKRIE